MGQAHSIILPLSFIPLYPFSTLSTLSHNTQPLPTSSTNDYLLLTTQKLAHASTCTIQSSIGPHYTYTYYVYVLLTARFAPPLPLSPFGGKSPRRRLGRVPPFGRVPPVGLFRILFFEWGAELGVEVIEEVAHFVRHRCSGVVTNVYAPFRLVPPASDKKYLFLPDTLQKKVNFDFGIFFGKYCELGDFWKIFSVQFLQFFGISRK